MNTRRKIVLSVLIIIVIVAAIAVIPLLGFINDYCEAVYNKDYTRIEKYLTAQNQFVFDGDLVSIQNDIKDPEIASYSIYVKDRQYTRPKR